MTRKDYNRIARALGESRADMGSVEEVLSALFPALEEDNPRFDRDRFRAEVWKVRDRVVVERAKERERELAWERLHG